MAVAQVVKPGAVEDGAAARRGCPWATVAVALAALGVAAWPAAGAVLEYERVAVLRGELWRLWTGHVVHYGASHLAWNLAVFVPAGVWLERLAPVRLRWLLVVAPVAIGGALLAVDASLARYAGLSGVATGVVALLALTKLGTTGSDVFFWRAVLGLVALKIAVEGFGAQPLFAVFDLPGVRTVPLAHGVGAGAAGLLWWVSRRHRAPASAHSGTL